MRLPGWEGRLAALLEAARAKPYAIGQHDCFRLACSVRHALTGEDRWPEFAGRYTTTAESRRVLAAHGKSFRAAFDWFFGAPSIEVKLAQRGDICAWRDVDGDLHLGVCVGSKTVVLGVDGLVMVPTLGCVCAWRVG